MIELLRTNDLVLLTFASHVLDEAESAMSYSTPI